MTSAELDDWLARHEDAEGYHTDKRGASARLSDAMDTLFMCGAEDELAAEHDVIYLPGGSDVIERMSTFQADELNGLGMHWDGEADCWAMFV